MLKKVGIAVVLVVAIFLAVVATRPATYHVERTVSMSAPADVVFADINDLHNFNEWSPWAKLDPNMKSTFDGPATGVGASHSWESDKAGKGTMTITKSEMNAQVVYKLEFKAPWEAVAEASIAVRPSGSGVDTTWSMNGNNNFGAKLAGMFMNMDSMIGKDFEDGLNTLKGRTEGKAKQMAEAAAQAQAIAQAQVQTEAAAEAAKAAPATKGKKK